MEVAQSAATWMQSSLLAKMTKANGVKAKPQKQRMKRKPPNERNGTKMWVVSNVKWEARGERWEVRRRAKWDA